MIAFLLLFILIKNWSKLERTATLLSYLLAVRYQGDYDAWIFPITCGYPAVATILN